MNTSDPAASGPTASSANRQTPLLPSALPRDASSFGGQPGATASSDGRHQAEAATAAAVTHATDYLRTDSGEAVDEEGGNDSGSLASRPAFAPFFTLVEDARTATSTHPAVRYIFSDDDSDVLTEALLRLNARSAAVAATSAAGAASDRTISAATAARRSSSDAAAAARSMAQPPSERAVVVTLGADGRSVVAAHSLTPDWQVLGAEVAAAPTLEGEEGETGGLMLRIQGTEGFRAEPSASSAGASQQPIALEGGLEAAVERYCERMEELRRVVEAGAPKSSQWM